MRHAALSLLGFLCLSFAAALCQVEVRDAEIRRICDQVETVQFPGHDRPTLQETQALAGCSSEDMYFGFGRPPDFVRARKCAYLEIDKNPERVFGGKALLMMIYANGKGAERNLDLAIRLACQVDAAQAEVEGRVAHLAKLQREHWLGDDFSLCDDITSGFMDGWCWHLNERFLAIDRAKRLDAVFFRWNQEDRAAFRHLQDAANHYFQTRSHHEVDLSGTSRAAFEIQEEASLRDGFVAAVERFERGQLPRFTAKEFRAADAALNSTYQAIQKEKADPGWGTVTAAGVNQTELAWIRYRDAWVTFGLRKYPKVTPESWKTWLTLERSRMLASMVRSR